jgi:hypothetical protein
MSYRRLTGLAIVLTLLALGFIEINAEPYEPIFWHLLATYDLPAGWLMVGMLFAAYFSTGKFSGNDTRANEFLLALDRRRYEVAVGLWVLLCIGSIWIYRNHPLSMDEYVALFQARVFAAGSLHGHFPPELLDQLIPRGFQNNFFMVNRGTGAVFSAYWPGFSLLLAPFVWLGIPWACNPTIVAGSFLLIGRVTREISGSPLTVGWALLFSIASPAFVSNGITYYSMPAHLLCSLAFALLLFSPSPGRLFLAGLVGGFALVLHNPFPHFVFALPWIAWLATRRGARTQNIGWLGLGYLPFVLLLGVGWVLWRQQILLVAPDSAGGVGQSLTSVAVSSFGGQVGSLARGIGRMFQWPDEFMAYRRVGGLVKLWLWAAPLLLLLAWFGGRGEKRWELRLLCASALFTFFGYFVIPFDQGHGWGYRYFHSAWGILPVFAAMGAMKLTTLNGSSVQYRLVFLALFSIVLANGVRFYQMNQFVTLHLAQFPPRIEKGPRIVMLNGRGYYAFDLIQNDPWLRGDEAVFLIESQSDRELLLARLGLLGNYEKYENSYGETLVLKIKKNLP